MSNFNLHHKVLLSLILSLALTASAQEELDLSHIQPSTEQYKIIEIKADTLPSLNIPRCGHEALCLDGQLTVFGGHTDGFIPTQTAEYFKDGQWHTVPMVYTHDHAVVIPLRSGKAFLAGGHKEPLGIGHLFSAELYDPQTNSFQGFGCLDHKRVFANALEMADGQIVVSGNWFEKDGIGMFENIYDPHCTNADSVKVVTYGRAKPYILRVSDDDAIIFSSLSNTNEPVDYSVVDRLKGETYNEPFLNTWTPIRTIVAQRSVNQFIGDESEGRYEWLIPVENDQTKQVAIAKVDGVTANNQKPKFSLFPLAQPLPHIIDGKEILYSSLVCNHNHKIAYLVGNDEVPRTYVVAFPYDTSEPAPLTIYRTEPQPITAQSITPMLTPDGDLVWAGGRLINNFDVSDAVILLPLSDYYGTLNGDTQESGEIAENSNSSLWWWILLGGLVILGGAAIIITKLRNTKSQQPSANQCGTPSVSETSEKGKDEKLENKTRSSDDESIEEESDIETDADAETETEEESPIDKNLPKDEILVDLFKRIEGLMEQEQLYLNPNLRASDVAVKVNSNTTYVSAAINSQCHCSFTQFLAGYRISYAQKLMREDPESKLSTISTLSGFTTDSTFFRAFRTITGMPPKEWLATNPSDKGQRVNNKG